MILDWNGAKGLFFLRVPRDECVTIQELRTSYGLDFSTSASTPEEAVFFTAEPYAAASFAKCATPAALTKLQGILAAVEASWATDHGGHFRCPADRELWPFQKASLAYALARTHSLVGDEPGLGKTPIAICYANEMQAKRVLVVCPANIRLQWQMRIREWSTMPAPTYVDAVTVGKRGVSPGAQWVVVSYDLARTKGIREALAAQHFDLLILDEAHYVKNNETKRTRTVFGGGLDPLPSLSERADRVLCLTGTPLPNRPREAYVLARNLCLGPDTQVLCEAGWKPICAVTKDDRLWDGIQWQTHAGVIFKGRKPTLTAAGLEATADHLMLCGGTWTTWQNVLGDAGTRSRALATGAGALLSLATLRAREASVSLSGATAAAQPTASPQQTCETESPCDATPAAIISLPTSPATAGRSSLPWPRPFVEAFSTGLVTLSPAVRTPPTGATIGMGAGVSECSRLGSQTEAPSWPTLQPFPGAEPRAMNLTEKTMIRDMSPAICGGFQRQSTLGTGERLPNWKPELRTWRPVYDIMNVGPRQQFTVLTEAGPVVVHNCWDSIDFLSEEKFRLRFNPSRVVDLGNGKRYVEEHSGRHAELQNRLRANFMVRHLKRDVMPQLHLPAFDLIYLEKTKAVKAALDAESLLGIDPECLEGCDPQIMGHIAAVRHQMGIALAPQVADYVDMLLKGGETKIVLFAWHIEVLNILCERLARWKPIRIDGSTSATQKQERVNEFQKDDARQIIIGNIQSMGTGTDGLQYVSNHALIAEPDWVHGVNVQAFDRLDRGGQERKVQGDLFVVQGSLAEKILASALRKGRITHAALDKRTYQ